MRRPSGHAIVPRAFVSGAEARRLASLFPSFRDFVDDALFHPAWGYYSTGQVRFGEGGHYDTFPLALSPVFGRMLATYGYRLWRRRGRPPRFEICELGAGNGQLALDVIVFVAERARDDRAWRAFAAALRYRIIERSPELITRQRQQLGSLGARVSWTRVDLTQRAARNAPFGRVGLVFANEVLDCLAHHKIVRLPDGGPGVVFVIPQLAPEGRQPLAPVPAVVESKHAVPRARLARILADDRLRHRLTFAEAAVPIGVRPVLQRFLQRHYPEFFETGRNFGPYFACPAIEPLVHNTAALYEVSEMLWIDYGDTREFHVTATTAPRVFAGPPRSGATVYDDPGNDDITFLVDFSVVGKAARQTGRRVVFYGSQGELARRSGVQLDRRARDLILHYRMLSWLLALTGVGPERQWRRTSVTWSKADGHGGRLRDDVRRAADEFLGKRRSKFKLMILR